MFEIFAPKQVGIGGTGTDRTLKPLPRGWRRAG
jgi:hypothetical protein